MKKVFGQTVRDIKREVNKTVLKVPRLEQKVLDATSNEPWGPHGTLLADIAQATRNFNECQMIMTVLWKRINDSGKNWRHVYKALTVLDYLVANGSERVLDEIKEHAYQISILFNFQYIDSRGRDQGINVRKKAQSLVNLVNDKERIIEVRQQADANREKFSTGGTDRPGGYGDRYDDDLYEERFGSRDEDKNGAGYGRDEDRYDRKRDSYSRDGDCNGRDYDEGLGRDYVNCRRSRSVDDFQRGSTDKNVDRDRDHAYDGQNSSQSIGVRCDGQSQDGKQLDKKLTEQEIGAPPSYEEAFNESRSPANKREGETSATPAPRTSGPPPTNSQSTCQSGPSTTVAKDGDEVFDDFDPRHSVSAAPSTSKSTDMDLLGSLTESFSNPLAIMPDVPVIPATASEPGASTNSGAAPSFLTSGSDFSNEMYANPFGDSPFKAVPSSDGAKAQPYSSASTEAFHSSMEQIPEPHHGGMLGADRVSNLVFGESFSTVTYPAHALPIGQSPPFNSSQDSFSSNQDVDILADILPPSQTAHSFSGYPALPSFPTVVGYTPQIDCITYGHLPVTSENFQTQSGLVGQISSGMPLPPGGSGLPVDPQMAPPMPAMPNSQLNNGSFYNQQEGPQPSSGPVPPSSENLNQHNFSAGATGNLLPQAEASTYHLQTQSGPVGQINNGMFLPNGGLGIAVNPQMATPMPGVPNSQLNSASFYNQQGGPQPSSGLVLPSSGNLNHHSFPTGAAANLLQQAETNTENLQGRSGPDGQFTNGMLLPNGGSGIVLNPQIAPMPGMPNSQVNSGGFYKQKGGPQPSSIPVPPSSGNLNGHSCLTGAAGNLLPRAEANTLLVSQHSLPPSTPPLSAVSNPSKDKFETKSTVWADTLSRGLVNLNISGTKTNPLADIGIDFDYLNRKDKRMEKPSQAPVASTITMGKAMGSGSGMGRTGAGALRPPPSPMMGSHMGMGSPGSAGGSMVMGGYGCMNQPGMGMGMNMNLGMSNMGSATNIGMGQQPMGIPQGTNMSSMAMPVGYNPMMNNPQQPYAGAYSMMNTPQQSYCGGYQ